MVLVFSKDKCLRYIKNCDLVVLGFNNNTPLFLSADYFKILRTAKNRSLKIKCQIILTFYVLCLGKKCVCGLRIKDGKVVDIFGECFTKKYLKFKIGTKIITILLYYSLYEKHGRSIATFSSLVLGLDNQPFDNINYLNNKYFNKLILVGLNNKIFCENLKFFKNKTKMLLNIMYKI